MEKIIKIKDTSATEIEVLLQDEVTLRVSLEEPVTARAIFDSLKYENGDIFSVNVERNNFMPNDSLDLFAKFYSDLAEGINNENKMAKPESILF